MGYWWSIPELFRARSQKIVHFREKPAHNSISMTMAVRNHSDHGNTAFNLMATNVDNSESLQPIPNVSKTDQIVHKRQHDVPNFMKIDPQNDLPEPQIIVNHRLRSMMHLVDDQRLFNRSRGHELRLSLECSEESNTNSEKGNLFHGAIRIRRTH
jgi:hypothetical protein